MDLTFLTLEEIKAQCRIAAEDTEEDGLLQMYGVSAEQTICKLINRSVLECIDEYGVDLDEAQPLKSAMLVLVGQMYRYREASTPDTVNAVPYGVQTMIAPYVRLTNRNTPWSND